jgi:hypothetical protein
MTALAMTRERERGTMENLLSTRVKPVEVMVGKNLPYIPIGYAGVVDRVHGSHVRSRLHVFDDRAESVASDAADWARLRCCDIGRGRSSNCQLGNSMLKCRAS